MEPGLAVQPAAEHPVVGPGRDPSRRPRWVGRLALGLAILTVAGVATGVFLAAVDLFYAAWIAGFAAIGSSALAVVAGTIAVIGRWGRAPGVAAIVVAVFANPLVLTRGLDLVAWS